MRRPSVIDFLIGNMVVIIGLAGGLIFVWQQYQSGDEGSFIYLLGGGFLLLWSNAARSRVAAWRAHQREWREMEQGGSAPRQRRPAGRAARFLRGLLLTLAAFAVVFGLPVVIFFVWGVMEKAGVRPPPVATVFPQAFLNYPFHAWEAAMGLWKWAQANRQDALVIGAGGPLALLATYAVWRVLRRVTRRWRGGQGGWDGTVQVMLPIPKGRRR